MDKYLCERCGKELVFRCAYSRIDHKLICIECDDKEQPKELMKKIADLEAKLAESEKKASKNYQEGYELYLKLKQFYSRLGVEAYADDEIQDVAVKELNKLLNEKEQLKQQLAEKDKEIEEMKEGQKDICLRCGGLTHKQYEQSQNQTAIAELEKAKNKISYYLLKFDYFTPKQLNQVNKMIKAIDQQIKSLKGEK